MKKQLNMVMNGKGGVGKSMFATNFVQYLKDRGRPFLAIDTDNENSTLKRYHPESIFINLDEPHDIDLMLSSLESHELVVVDCRAASTDLLLDYLSEVNAFEVLAALHASLTMVLPVNHEADSVEQIKLIVSTLGQQCRYVVVKNQAHSEQFRIFDGSQSRKRILGELGGMEITMPRLYDWLVTLLNEFSLTVTDAMGSKEVSLMDRQRLKNWQSKFNEQVDYAAGLLLPRDQSKQEGRSKKSKISSRKEERSE